MLLYKIKLKYVYCINQAINLNQNLKLRYFEKRYLKEIKNILIMSLRCNWKCQIFLSKMLKKNIFFPEEINNNKKRITSMLIPFLSNIFFNHSKISYLYVIYIFLAYILEQSSNVLSYVIETLYNTRWIFIRIKILKAFKPFFFSSQIEN